MFEPNLKQKIEAVNRLCDDYFDVAKFDFVISKSENSQEYVVDCNDILSFVQFIKEKRNVDDVHFKIGADSGGKFLKSWLSIQSKSSMFDNITDKPRSSYSDGLLAKNFKDSGVNKIFLIVMVQFSEENYDNLELMWDLLKLATLDSTLAAGLKINNIVTGLMAHSACFPCTWCDTSKYSLEFCGNLRTIGDCLQNFNLWNKHGANK